VKNTRRDPSLLRDVATLLAMAACISGATSGCGGRLIESSDGLDDGSVPERDTGLPDVEGRDTGSPDVTILADATTDGAREAAEEAGPPAGIVTIPLSGCVPSYTADITIGGTQSFQLVLDTGSTTLGVASSTCSDCLGVTPRYKPGPTAVDEGQMAMTEYQSGNTWTGEIYQDSVSAGMPAAKAPVKLAAIDTQSTFFMPVTCQGTPAPYQGIIGFAPAMSAVPGTNGYFDDLVATGFTPNLFAIQLCDTGGTLWLGGYDMTHVTAPVQYVPMPATFLGQYSYVVDLQQVVVDGTTVPLANGDYTLSLLDTGTSSFILNTAAYNAVTAAITGDSVFQSTVSTNPHWFDNEDDCVSLTQTEAELNAALPTMTLVYGTSPQVTIQAVASESYLFNYDGMWCPALYSYPSSDEFPFAGIIGSPVLKSAVTVFDRAGSRVGFAPHAPCP
jgi:hypothetical protein